MQQSYDELADQLEDQLSFLDASCAAFDKGDWPEAKRLALAIRVLVHDTAKSRSLLQLMGVKSGVPFAEGVPESSIALIEEVTADPDRSLMLPGLAGMEISSNFSGYRPQFTSMLAMVDAPMVPFEQWWTPTRMLAPDDLRFSRRNLVLWMTNNDGGAHVDNLHQDYRALTRDNAMHATFTGPATGPESPVAAAIRQIAEETRYSIRTFQLHP